MAEKLAFLGTGWSFPPTFDKAAKGVLLVSGLEDVCQSLHILLDTALGERVMQPRYGASLESMVFEPLNSASLTLIDDIVRTAIIYNEPRIKLLGVDISTEQQLEGLLRINIIFELRSTNTRFNFVYPFYIQEGTEV